ncbi:MAG: DedA family protein [Methylibium sp.]|nr:DedA family protein [Methylibium sp.]MBA3623106.1 DedA family protein [Methylibium sp.]
MVDAITHFIGTQGYWAIALLMFAENIFPPLPSELIMPFAGFVAARGELHPALVVAAGAFGSVLGALPWFLAARYWGGERLKQLADRHGRWVTVSREELDRAEQWFHRRGSLVLVFGRLLPGVRTLIAVPAGFTGMALAPFIAWSALGSLLWSALLTGAGYLMESRYEQIAVVLDPAAKLVLAAIAGAYVVRVIRAGRR